VTDGQVLRQGGTVGLYEHTKMAPVRIAVLVEGLTAQEGSTFPMAVTEFNAARPAVPLPLDAPSAGVIHVRHRHHERFTVVGNHRDRASRRTARAPTALCRDCREEKER
jgi:hypothetical protein